MSQQWWCILAGALLMAGCDRQPPANPVPVPPTSRAGLPGIPQPTVPTANLPEITAEAERGIVDLVFRIQDHKKLPDGSQRIRVAGVHKGQELGFEVILGPAWVTGSGPVSFRRTGAESDAFIHVLDELYGVRLGSKVMVTEVSFAAISLEGAPGNLARGPTKMKLFYGDLGENQYAELYTNIDLAARKLQFNEKDVGYRSQIVRALRGD